MSDESSKFKDDLGSLFGPGAQSALSRFLILCGDTRSMRAIRRSISNYAAGKYPVPGELKALINILLQAHNIPDLLAEARKEPNEAPYMLRDIKSDGLS
jgi:hypothetical protein